MKNLAYRTVRGGASGKTSSRVIIAHGLLGSSANWATVAQRLAEHNLLRSTVHEIKMIDMRNHGNSPHVSPHTNAAMASDLEIFTLQQQQEAAKLQSDDGGVVLIGHSMGGVALMSALLRRTNEAALLLPSEEEFQARCARGDYHGWRDEQGDAKEMRFVNETMGFPARQSIYDTLFINEATDCAGLSRGDCPQRPCGLRVRAAIIVDITPTVRIGKQDDSSSSVASTLDAMARADLSRMCSYADGSKELERAGLRDKALRDFVLTNLHLDSKTGTSRWRCNLSTLRADYIHTKLNLKDWFLQSPVEGGTPGDNMIAPLRCALPTLFVFGEKSPYNTKEDRDLINRFFSNYTEVEVADAGHFVHYEKMRAFVETVAPFIAEHL